MLKGASSQLTKVIAWLKRNEEITLIDADYVMAANIKVAARKQGSVVELPGCLIASVAVRLDQTLVTENTEDFRAIQRNGINPAIENWR